MEELEQRQVKRARYEDLSFGIPIQTLDSNSFCTPVCQKRLERIDQKIDESSLDPTCDSGEVTPKSSPSSVKGSIPEQVCSFIFNCSLLIPHYFSFFLVYSIIRIIVTV